MAKGKMRWAMAILALALWAGVPYGVGQQQAAKPKARAMKRNAHGQKRAGRQASGAQAARRGVSSRGAVTTPRSIPESGTPTVENPRGTGDLNTLPNQTLTPGATTVPDNAGGIAPASNDASSGEYTPSEGNTAPTTPGGNPSETQGVPTFSSGAQPANANLPRTVNPAAGSGKENGSASGRKTRRTRRNRGSSQGANHGH